MFAGVIGGLAIAAVMLLGALFIGFFTYEATWKLRRLRTDLSRLGDLDREFAMIAGQLEVIRARAAARGDR